MKTALMIASDGLRGRAIRDVSESQAEAEDIQAAIAKAEQITHPAIRVWAFNTIGKEQGKAGDVAAGKATLDKAFAMAQNLESSLWRARSMSTIAEARAEIGDAAGAEQAFAQALAVAHGIRATRTTVGGR